MQVERSKVAELSRDEREIAIIRLCTRGVKTRDCIAYHAMPFETLLYLVEYGKIPGYTGKNYNDPDLPQKGDIYFLPRRATFPFEKLKILLSEERVAYKDEDLSLRDTITLARDNSPGYAMCRFLGIDINFAIYMSDYLESGKETSDYLQAEEILDNLGISHEQRMLAKRFASKRKEGGVVVALARKALDMYPRSVGDGGNDFRLCTGDKGLCLDAIAGLRVLGREEKSFVRKLRKKHGI